MMLRTRGALTGAMLGAASVFITACGGKSERPGVPPSPGAVTYTEIQRRGGDNSVERGFDGDKGGITSIDVNSLLRIDVDEAALADLIVPGGGASASTDAVRRHIAELTAALAATTEAERLEVNAFEDWQQAVDQGDSLAAREAVQGYARATGPVFDALEATIRARMRQADPQVVEAELGRLLGAAMAGGSTGLQWRVIRNVLSSEIATLDRTLDTLALSPEPAVQIRAHFLPSGQEAVALALPGYNDETLGPSVLVEKIVLEVPEDQQALHKQYGILAAGIGEKKSAAEALRSVLQLEVEQHRAALEGLARASTDLLDAAGDELTSWASAFDPVRFDAVQAQLQGAAGADLSRTVEALAASLADLSSEIQGLRALSSLSRRLPGMSADQALTTLLDVARSIPDASAARLFDASEWRARVDLLNDLRTGLSQMRGTARVRVLSILGTELAVPSDHLVEALQAWEAAARPVADFVMGLVARSGPVELRDLPEPRGQRTVELTGPADTELDITRIGAGRKAGDELTIRVTPLLGDQILTSEWTDRLRLGSYGTHARAVASLAFAQRSGTGTWVPLPALSWVVSYVPWPNAKALDPRRLPMSIGVSAMSLDFNDKEVELGLAATVGLLGDWVLIGHGWNLQETTDRRFWFFSLRLLEGPGGIGK